MSKRSEASALRVVFCWTTISGYMAACWRALAARPGVDLHVLAYQADDGSNTAFSDAIMRGFSSRLLPLEEQEDITLVEEHVASLQPSVVVMTGWWRRQYRALPFSPRLRGCGFIMGMDTPWRTPLQYLNRVRVGRFLQRLDRVVVAGERSWQHARRLGVPTGHIQRGQYGVDATALRSHAEARARGPWPRSFLFAGRYVPEKDIATLVEGYRRYRQLVRDPWPLVCCGQGPLASLLAGVEGVRDAGFVQPDAMGELWRQAGAFVIPSRFDPWPLALVEAAAAGLPIVASDACGSTVEVLRPRQNGLCIPAGDASALAAALREIHDHIDVLPDWGSRSIELAAPHSAERWAERWEQYLVDVAAEKQRVVAR